MLYETAEEASARLHSSVIMKGKTPIYVCEVRNYGGVVTLFYNTLDYYHDGNQRQRDWDRTPITDPELDAHNLRLGYCNLDNRSIFTYRIPTRRYKQGLDSQNFGYHIVPTDRVRYDLGVLLRKPGFEAMLKGDYPSFDEAAETVCKHKSIESVAFSRSLAISRDPELELVVLTYKGQRIAHGDCREFILPPKHNHLFETLNKNGVKLK